jgi:hypothetical protein
VTKWCPLSHEECEQATCTRWHVHGWCGKIFEYYDDVVEYVMLSKYYATLVNFVKKYSCDMDGIYLGISFFVHTHMFTITWRGSWNTFMWIDITSTNINIKAHDDGLLAIIAPNCGIIIIMHNVGEVCEQVVWHIKHCPPKSNM